MQRLEYVQHIVSLSRFSDAGFILRVFPLHQLTRFIVQVFNAGQHSDADELHRLSTAVLDSHSLTRARW